MGINVELLTQGLKTYKDQLNKLKLICQEKFEESDKYYLILKESYNGTEAEAFYNNYEGFREFMNGFLGEITKLEIYLGSRIESLGSLITNYQRENDERITEKEIDNSPRAFKSLPGNERGRVGRQIRIFNHSDSEISKTFENIFSKKVQKIFSQRNHYLPEFEKILTENGLLKKGDSFKAYSLRKKGHKYIFHKSAFETHPLFLAFGANTKNRKFLQSKNGKLKDRFELDECYIIIVTRKSRSFSVGLIIDRKPLYKGNFQALKRYTVQMNLYGVLFKIKFPLLNKIILEYHCDGSSIYLGDKFGSEPANKQRR